MDTQIKKPNPKALASLPVLPIALMLFSVNLLAQTARAQDHYERKFLLSNQLLTAESEVTERPVSELGILMHQLLYGGAQMQKHVDDLAPSTPTDAKARADQFCSGQAGYSESVRFETIEPQFLAPPQKELLAHKLESVLHRVSANHAHDSRLKFEVPISLFSEVTCRGEIRPVILSYMKDPVRISQEYEKVHGTFEYQQGVPHYFGGGYDQVKTDPYFQRILNRLLTEDQVELVAERDLMQSCIGWVCSWL